MAADDREGSDDGADKAAAPRALIDHDSVIPASRVRAASPLVTADAAALGTNRKGHHR
jgi:hypothetical protein